MISENLKNNKSRNTFKTKGMKSKNKTKQGKEAHTKLGRKWTR